MTELQGWIIIVLLAFGVWSEWRIAMDWHGKWTDYRRGQGGD